MTKLDFDILAEDYPPLPEGEMDRLRKLYPVEDEEFSLTPLGRAVDLVRQGIPVFPCRPDNNAPCINGGFHGATLDEKQARQWFGIKYPQARVGIPNGNASGLTTLDVDVKPGKDGKPGKNGFATLKKLFPAEVLEGWTSTFWYYTPSGGAHFLFRDPDGKIGRRIGEFETLNGGNPTGIDILGEGGYFVFHDDEIPSNLLDRCLELPVQIIEALECDKRSANDNAAPQAADPAADHHTSPETPNDDRRMAQALAALQGRAGDLAEVTDDQNDALFSGLRYLSPWIAHGYLSQDEVYQAFRSAYQANGYIEKDGESAFNKSFASGLSKLATDASKTLPNLKERPKPGAGGQREGQREDDPSHANGARYEPGPNGAGPGSSAGPEAKGETSEANGSASAKAEGPGNALDLRARLFVWQDPASIPPRRWIYGGHYIADYAAMTAAMGAAGKSSLVIVEALSIITGRPLLGVTPNETGNVWIFNLEDPIEEMQRRVTAPMIEYGIPPEEVAGRLFINSGRDTPLVLAQETQNGTVICKPVEEALVEQLIARDIRVLIIDPFVSCHQVRENDNDAIDMVAKTWGRIAGRAHCSVELVHHTRKMNGNTEPTIDDGRGASALAAAVRSGRVLARMTKGEAKALSVETPGRYFKVLDGKPNLAPLGEGATWYRMASVELGNGDNIGVCKAYEFATDKNGHAPKTRKKTLRGAKANVIRAIRALFEDASYEKTEHLCGSFLGIGEVTSLPAIREVDAHARFKTIHAVKSAKPDNALRVAWDRAVEGLSSDGLIGREMYGTEWRLWLKEA